MACFVEDQDVDAHSTLAFPVRELHLQQGVEPPGDADLA
jgi:hypothetical protein